MARRRRRTPTEESDVDTAADEGQPEGADDLSLDLGYADEEPPKPAAVSEEVLAQLGPPAVEFDKGPEGEVLAEFDGEPSGEAIAQRDGARTDADAEDEEFRERLEAAVAFVLESRLARLESRLDQRSRDRTQHALLEATDRLAQVEAGLAVMQEGTLDRLERVEEACGLRPSLLTTAESAVAQLDEMAQEGNLRAEDIRAIHRKLRMAVQEERARRQT